MRNVSLALIVGINLWAWLPSPAMAAPAPPSSAAPAPATSPSDAPAPAPPPRAAAECPYLVLSAASDRGYGPDCPIAIDFGDAPDSYGTLIPNGGPGHVLTELLTPGKRLLLGGDIDAGLDGIATKNADGDDVGLPVDDEDAVPADWQIDLNEPSLTVPVTNSTGSGATVAGWLDLNGSGTFEPSERATFALKPGASSGQLIWTPPRKGTAPDATYLRLRLYPGEVANPQATGKKLIDGGEVEDHVVGLTRMMPRTGDPVGPLVKVGLLLLVCGGLGWFMGGVGTSRRGIHR